MKDLFKFAFTLLLVTTLVAGYVSIQLIIVAVAGTLLPTWAFVLVLAWLVYTNYRILLKGGEFN